MMQHVKNSDHSLFKDFFCPSLLETKAFKLDLSQLFTKLDQNESSFDWPHSLKEKITKKMLDIKWNQYPQDYPLQLQAKIAEYSNLPFENIVLCPGSNYHICAVIDLLTHYHYEDIVIARPSFPLYENHCKYRGLNYRVWNLNSELEYDLKNLPKLNNRSIVIFASPNNPVGNTLKVNVLEQILKDNPNCIFIADEAYYEFTCEPFTPLLEHYSNLIIVRTFSKALSSAGIRLGYTAANSNFTEQLKKVTLPFLINIFTSTALEIALEDKSFTESIKENTAKCIKERQRIFNEILRHYSQKKFKIYPSQANFLLLTFFEKKTLTQFEKRLAHYEVICRNVSNPFLANAIRITVGSYEENQKLLMAFKEI